jgi:octaprenyl-diphosphate synthase
MSKLIGTDASQIKGELKAVDERLQELLSSPIPAISDLGQYLVESGGKRFRPALALLFYKLLGAQGSRESVIELATILEMIHLATLAHDDVIDQAEMRRHRASLWKRSTSRTAILEGDFIFSRAFRVLNKYPFGLRDLIISTVEELLSGELLQESLRGQLPSLDQYRQVIQGKTAALIRAACAVGALLGNPNLEERRLKEVKQAGEHLGIAYQMFDDWLDIFGDGVLGKPLWSDPRGGWFTWPFVTLVAETQESKTIYELLDQVTEDGKGNEEARHSLLNHLQQAGLSERFRRAAHEEIKQAERLLDWLENSPLKQLLFANFEVVTQRRF